MITKSPVRPANGVANCWQDSSTRTCILRPKTAGHISKSKGHLRGCHDSCSLIFHPEAW